MSSSRDAPTADHRAAVAKLYKQLADIRLGSNQDIFRAQARIAMADGVGSFTRLTVQVNLFEGSVSVLGKDEHKEELREYARKNGQRRALGCFALTEVGAGVVSGMVVQTTAKRQEDGSWLLHTPTELAAKNWISQALVAKYAVVLATTSDEKTQEEFGVNAFFVDLDEAVKTKRVTIADMGHKTVANDLDNGRITFNQLRLPASAIMDACGLGKGFAVVFQRLLTGRLGIADAMLLAMRRNFDEWMASIRDRVCLLSSDGSSARRLVDMPRVANAIRVYERDYAYWRKYVDVVKRELLESLDKQVAPDRELTEKVAVAKIGCVDHALTQLLVLKREIGAHVLKQQPPSLQVDGALCGQFAEGDTHVLQEKIARDCLRALQKRPVGWVTDVVKRKRSLTEAMHTLVLGGQLAASALFGAAASSAASPTVKSKAIRAWHDCWRQVYRLAEARQAQVVHRATNQ